MTPPHPITADAAVFGRLIKPDRGDFSPATAREILTLRSDEIDHERMNLLSVKAQDGDLIAEEQAELESFRRAGYLLGVLWSKARLSLKRADGDAAH